MSKNPSKPEGKDYTNFVNLMAVHAEASTRLAALQANADARVIDILDDHRDEYTKLQSAIVESEASLEVILRRNQDTWLGEKKSIKCPYGTASFRGSSKLHVENDELSVALVERMPDGDLYLNRETTLDLEALEALDDATLASLKIRRVRAENFSVKPAKIDLGKAGKAAAEAGT